MKLLSLALMAVAYCYEMNKYLCENQVYSLFVRHAEYSNMPLATCSAPLEDVLFLVC